MDEMLDSIREFCAGKSAEEIEQDLAESSFADRIPDPKTFARYLASIAAEPDDDDGAVGPDDEPTADVDLG